MVPETESPRSRAEERDRLRRIAVQVIVVQVVSLVILWVLQATYGTG